MSHPSPQSLCTGLLHSFKHNSDFALCLPNLSSISWNTISTLWWWLWLDFNWAIQDVQRGQRLPPFIFLVGNKNSHELRMLRWATLWEGIPQIVYERCLLDMVLGGSVGMAMSSRYLLEILGRIWSSVVLWNSEVLSVAAATYLNINSRCIQKDGMKLAILSQ